MLSDWIVYRSPNGMIVSEKYIRIAVEGDRWRGRNMIRTKLPFYCTVSREEHQRNARLPSLELYASISDFSKNWTRHSLENIYESTGKRVFLHVYRIVKRLVKKKYSIGSNTFILAEFLMKYII